MQSTSDFSDKVPPMLVKELRQGLRTKAFVFQFLIFQALMLILLLAASAGANADGAGNVISNIIFTFFGVVALFFQPIRGTSALAGEITGNTMEMMVLTRLSSTRIVMGKWFSLVSQTGLLLVTIIPYLILRYFFGGMSILGEMILLVLIFFTSAALSAVTVGLSARANRLTRAVPILLIIFLVSFLPRYLFAGGGGMINSLISFCSLDNPDAKWAIPLFVSVTSYLAWCALNLGIAGIAPSAENHSSVPRIVSLVLTLVVSGFCFTTWMEPMPALTLFALVGGPAVLVALLEQSLLLPPICTPFVKRGTMGRLAGVFLYPGWPTGVFYSFLLMLIAGLSISATDGFSLSDDGTIGALSLAGSIMLAVMLANFFTKTETKRFLNFMMFLILANLITILATVFLNIWEHQKLLWLFAWNPSTFLAMAEARGFHDDALVLGLCLVDGVIILTLSIQAILAFGKYQPVINEAEVALEMAKK